MNAIKNILVVLMVCSSSIVCMQGHAQAPATVPATITPAQKAAVKELLEAMNFKKMMSQMAGVMAQNMPQIMDQTVANLDVSMSIEQKAEARKLAGKTSESAMKSILDIYNDPQVIQGMEDIMARAYGSNFAVDEIKAITAFYASPAGNKMLSIQPQIMQQSMPEIMALISPRMNVLMSKMAKDIAVQAKAPVKTNIVSEKK